MSRHRLREESGQSLIEFALLMPMFILIMVGATDFARFAYASIEISNAARAGVQYGAQSYITALDSAGMQQAAINDGPDVSALQATATNFCKCTDGTSITCANSDTTCLAPARVIQYVRVNTTATLNPLFNYPGLPKSLTLNGQTSMRWNSNDLGKRFSSRARRRNETLHSNGSIHVSTRVRIEKRETRQSKPLAQRRRAIPGGDRIFCHCSPLPFLRNYGNEPGALYLPLPLRGGATGNALCIGARVSVYEFRQSMPRAGFRHPKLRARAGLSGHRAGERHRHYNLAHHGVSLQTSILAVQQPRQPRSHQSAIQVPAIDSLCSTFNTYIVKHVSDDHFAIDKDHKPSGARAMSRPFRRARNA